MKPKQFSSDELARLTALRDRVRSGSPPEPDPPAVGMGYLDLTLTIAERTVSGLIYRCVLHRPVGSIGNYRFETRFHVPHTSPAPPHCNELLHWMITTGAHLHVNCDLQRWAHEQLAVRYEEDSLTYYRGPIRCGETPSEVVNHLLDEQDRFRAFLGEGTWLAIMQALE